MHTNNEKITPDFCKGRILIFYPKTEEEAVFIQEKLFAMGARWKTGATTIGHCASCVEKGMELDAGVMYTSPPAADLTAGFLCTSDQFDEAYLSPDRAFMLALFNKLSARIEDIGAKVDAIYNDVHPARLDKAILKKPEGNDAPKP